MNNCIFCMIAQRKKNANVLWENKYVMAFLDNDPISDGHTLIIPKKDIRSINDLDETTGRHIMNAVKIITSLIEKTFNFDGVAIMAVNGYFQDVPHFHIHVFGRDKNNDIKIKYPLNINKRDNHLAINAEKMKIQLK